MAKVDMTWRRLPAAMSGGSPVASRMQKLSVILQMQKFQALIEPTSVSPIVQESLRSGFIFGVESEVDELQFIVA